MAEELARKKKVRGTHKGVITKLLNKIEEITKAEAEPTAELESKFKGEIGHINQARRRNFCTVRR